MEAPDVRVFLDVVSHDLRAPIASVRTMISLLSEGYLGDMPPRQEELVRRIEARLESLQTLVDRLIDLAARRSGDPAGAASSVAAAPPVERAVETGAGRPVERAVEAAWVALVVREAVERCSGAVTIDREEDAGTTVTIRLPPRHS